MVFQKPFDSDDRGGSRRDVCADMDGFFAAFERRVAGDDRFDRHGRVVEAMIGTRVAVDFHATTVFVGGSDQLLEWHRRCPVIGAADLQQDRQTAGVELAIQFDATRIKRYGGAEVMANNCQVLSGGASVSKVASSRRLTIPSIRLARS